MVKIARPLSRNISGLLYRNQGAQHPIRFGLQFAAPAFGSVVGHIEYHPGALREGRERVLKAFAQGASDGVSHAGVADFFPDDEAEAGAFLFGVEIAKGQRSASHHSAALENLFIHERLVEPALIKGEAAQGRACIQSETLTQGYLTGQISLYAIVSLTVNL